MPDIFLSYSRDDQATARRFAEAFEREGFSVWWDQTLNAGEAYDEVTEQALEAAKAVVVLWSGKSVASRWVRAEATQADRAGTLVPAMIEPCKRPIMFELKQTADLSGWSGDTRDKTWQSYLSSVRRLVEKGDPDNIAPRTVQPVQTNSRRPNPALLAVGAAAALIVAALWWWQGRAPGKLVEQPAAVASTPVPAAGPISLAVLPFADMSPAKDQEYFSDGLTEELLNQLAQVKALRVTARTSSFSFKGRNEDMRVIGEKLGVANILEGSVRKDGNQLRITAQLVNSKDGSHLWSKTYDRELSGVFALQEEVAKDVAKALSITLDVGDMPRVDGGTTDVVAYDKYLHARELYLQGGRAPAVESVQNLREAVALDPKFSRAWLLLAYALPETLIGVPPNEFGSVPQETRAATERVLALSPDAWWAHALRANQYMRRNEWANAEAALSAARVAAVNAPNEFMSDGTYGAFLVSVGRIREAVRHLEQARQLNPLSALLSGESQIWQYAAGQTAQAEAEFERSERLFGNHQRPRLFALVRELASKESTPASVDARFRALLEAERLRMPLVHELARNFRDPAKVRAAIEQAIIDPENQDSVRMTANVLLADGFGETGLALAAMRRAVVDFHSMSALWFHFKTGLRADPRFKEILRDMGLVEYFRASGNWGDFCKPVGVEDFECH